MEELREKLLMIKNNGISLSWVAKKSEICERSLQAVAKDKSKGLSKKNMEKLTVFFERYAILFE